MLAFGHFGLQRSLPPGLGRFSSCVCDTAAMTGKILPVVQCCCPSEGNQGRHKTGPTCFIKFYTKCHHGTCWTVAAEVQPSRGPQLPSPISCRSSSYQCSDQQEVLWCHACPNLTWDMLYKTLHPLEPCPCAGALPIPVT